MATIYVGSGTPGSYTDGNFGNGTWNFTEKAIWSNVASAADGFYFANSDQATAYGIAGNEAFVWNGAGGTDSIFLGTYGNGTTATSGHTFNLAALQTDGASQKYLVSGTSLGDKFNWSDGTAFLSTGAFSLNGGLGTDTLQLTSAASVSLANLSLTSVEIVAGTAGAENVIWKGTGGFSFDLAGGTDTLNLSTATTGQDIRLSNVLFKNIEALVGTAVADTLGGSSAAENFDGGAGNDILWGAAGADSLKGGVGADTYFFGLGDGADSIFADTTNSKSDVVLFQGAYGTAAFADLSFATAGEDLTIGINGVDSLYIEDWAGYATSTAKDNRISKFVASDLTFGLALSNGTTSSLFGADTSIAYYMQAQTAAGDTLKAGTTADTLIGGDGSDTFQFTSTSGAVLYDGKGTADTDLLTANDYSAGAVSVYLQNETTKYKNIENLTGSSMGDLLGGNSLANVILGGAGADSIYGAAGADAFTGGTGADSYWFGAGDGIDTISDANVVAAKDDAVIFWGNAFNDLSIAARATSATDYEIGIKNTTDKIVLTGAGTQTSIAGVSTNSFDRVNKFITTDMTFGLTLGQDGADDTLKGTSIADYILGGDGNDSINGYAGVDALYGQADDDTIVYTASSWIDGGTGTDVVTAQYATAGVSIELNASRITNVEKLIGSAYADKLGGTSAAEFLVGGDGADSIWGAGGNDTLEGGLGADSYWFGVGDGTDTIASGDYNNLDTVVFYGAGVGGGGITSTIASGANLTIGLSSGDSLTLENWIGTAGQKLNRFRFEEGSGAGTYSLTVDGTNTPTWTLIS